MKTILLLSLLLVFSHDANTQANENIIVGKKETIYSKVLKENRKIWIYTPANTSPAPAEEKRYPVLYLLDGDAHFFSTVGIVQQLSQANGNGVLPEMIVVGIENTNRLRDLTPKPPTDGKLTEPGPFVHFLSTELMPYIDKNYPTSPYRILTGHSLGGLLAIDIMTNFPYLFNSYIAIDPSMWYNNEKYLNHAIAQLQKQNLQGKRLFIGTANSLPAGMTLSDLNNDHSPETQHIRSLLKFDQFLKSNKNGLLYAQQYYEHEQHNTVPLLSEYDGLKFIFGYYLFNASEKDFTDSTTVIAEKLKQHYATVSHQMGYQVAPPESFLNYLGYAALTQKQYRKAEALFKLNLEYYPNSNSVYEAYGDYFVAINDTVNAVNYYKKAVAIKNVTNTVTKLNALTKQETFSLTPAELQKYVGTYILEAYNIPVILEIKDGKLWSKVPGQADNEFLPVAKDVFTIKGEQGYTITFQMSNNQPVMFTSVQPNGTFKAVYKK